MPLAWLGRPSKQALGDLWAYQAIITETAPDVIVELGAGQGGTALYLASVCAVLGHGRVITVDRGRTHHDGYRPVTVEDRLTWLLGDLASLDIYAQMRAHAEGQRVMVIHDAEHDVVSVLRDLDLYAPLVTPGCYLIVCDTNQLGAAQAVARFLVTHPDFTPDPAREPADTWNPGGYLRRSG